MYLGTQYYRPPFPNAKYWEDDLKRMADAGLNTVQLWIVWAWVEAHPGTFDFADYDRIVELAAKNGIGVVLSTIAEIHPYWIHNVVPGSEMIDHMGHKVISTNRGEIHFGLTPGGCFDHPGVWDRQARFLRAAVEHYRGAPNLVGWDAWNELRWNVHSDGLVCYCEHTLRKFRNWLEERYGGLDGLNDAWIRRYRALDEVLPGKLPNRPYTEMMAWEHFLTWRATEHGKARYDLMKPLDPHHPVTVHGGAPTPGYGGSAERGTTALDRGNDWFYADHLDGVGCSSFPKWFGIDDADFGVRVEYVRSAARDKRVWLSEVQGGRSAHGFSIFPSVDALSQQRWIWNGIACGAETVLFWCWRDEVFGRESSGFGIIGTDGLAEERVAAMQVTGRLIREHADLIDGYAPVKPDVGVLFSPQTYYLTWAQDGDSDRARDALDGYCRGLVKKSIPYAVVEEEHLEALDDLKVLFLPRTIVTSAETESALEAFVRGGGTLVCESECGAFAPNGLYRYPEDRFTARMAGFKEVGRRMLPDSGAFEAEIDGETVSLGVKQWLTPWEREEGTVWADGDDGALIVEVPIGEGRLILCGAYFGDSYFESWTPGFEDFLEGVVRGAGWSPDVEVVAPKPTAEAFVYIKSGESGGKKVVFVFFPPDCDEAKLRFREGFLEGPSLTDIISGETFALSGGDLALPVPEWRFAMLVESV